MNLATRLPLPMPSTGGIIVGAKDAFNEYDGNCLAPLLEQVEAITGKRPERAFCDCGFCGRTKIGGTEIVIPDSPPKNATTHYKRKARAKFRRRRAVEAIISHVKRDFRMLRNYLKGITGDKLNPLLAAVVFNFKKRMRATARLFFILFFIQIFMATMSHGKRLEAMEAS